ncbi:MAG: hypothetical protein AB7N61_07255 [Acidimicrobiia bacterium]
MRRRLIVIVAAVAILGIAAAIVASRGDNDSSDKPSVSGLPTRTVQIAGVTVKVEPEQLDAAGASFVITLDSHTVDLSADLAGATLTVGEADWPVVGWTGDGPGGHHREGSLRFTPTGSATGTALLVITGFSEPVSTSWELGT